MCNKMIMHVHMTHTHAHIHEVFPQGETPYSKKNPELLVSAQINPKSIMWS